MNEQLDDVRRDVPAPPIGVGVWDLLVIGGGTAGILAATTAAGFGATVLLVESGRTGGDCLWTGCVPSKALLAAAGATASARRATRVGVRIDGVHVDFADVMRHVHSAIAQLEPKSSPDALAVAGVRVAAGRARLIGSGAADVEGQQVRFRQAILATGSEPAQPAIPGLAAVQPLTSESVWSLTELPERLVVVGGGSIGCELGQAFARLGSTVSLVEAQPRLLSREDAAASRAVAAALGDDGVCLHLGASVTNVRPGVVEIGGGTTTLTFDRLLIATGRRPRTSRLGLAAAGVECDERGYVRVDAHLRTTNRRIWAAGDITGHPAYTHTAGAHGAVAATNAILGRRSKVETGTIPRVTFTRPEVASVGVNTQMAQRHRGLTVRTVSHTHLDRAITDSNADGFTRIVVDGKGRILGATIVGPCAGEVLGELVLAIRQGLRANDLAAAIHPYPTYGYGPWTAAIDDVRARLCEPRTARAIALLAAVRRRWLDVRR